MRLKTIYEAIDEIMLVEAGMHPVLNDDISDIIYEYIGEIPDDLMIKQIDLSTFNIDEIEKDLKSRDERGIKHAKNVDLSQPIILWNGKLMDGFHRIYKASKKGIKSLPYIELSNFTDEEPPKHLYTYIQK